MFVKKRAILLEIFFIFLLSLTPLLWFRPGEIMVGHDNVFPLEPKSFLKDRLFTWSEKDGFGYDQSLILGSIPIHLIDALPYYLGFSLINTQKIVYVFWFFLTGVSIYVLASVINSQSRFFKLLAVVFYQFNFFVLQGWFIGERTKISAYIALPLVLSIFVLFYQRKLGLLKAVSLNSLVLFLFNAGGLYGLPLYGGFFIVLGTFIFYYLVFSLLQKRYQQATRLIAVTVLTIIGCLLINAYYFLPVFYQVFDQYKSVLMELGGKEGQINWARMISVGAGPLNLFRLQGMAEWYDNPQHSYAKFYLNNPILIFISFIWPLLVFLSLIVVKEKRYLKVVLYFLLVYLVGIFFAAGAHPPFGFLYELMMRLIPGFAIFRSPFYKFAPALTLASSILGAFTLVSIRNKISKHERLSKFFFLLCLILVLAYYFPFFTGNFFNWQDNFSTRLEVPQYVYDFGAWVNYQKNDDLGILFLPPPDDNWNYEIYNWGFLSLYPLPRLLTSKPTFFINEEVSGKEEEKLLKLVYQSLLNGDQTTFNGIASILRIGYIVICHDFSYNLKWTKTVDPEEFKKSIEVVFNFPKEREFGQWIVYKIPQKSTFGKIYSADSLSLTSSVDLYSDFFQAKREIANNFAILDESTNNPSPIKRAGLFVSCLTCQVERTSSFVEFPNVTFLPGSPFYFLVQREERISSQKKLKPEERVYHEAGISLKRTAELRRIMLDSPPRSREERIKSLIFFQEAINNLEETLFEIPQSSQKILINEKINLYLTTERGELGLYYKQATMDSETKKFFETVIWQLDDLINKISPFLFNQDFETKKLFSFNLPSKGKFNIYLKKEEIKNLLGGEEKMNLTIDGEKVLDKYAEDENWFDFGEQELGEGEHQLLLSLPSSLNLTTHWLPTQKKLTEGVSDCFFSKIEGFSPKDIYQVKLQYRNNLYEDLFYYTKEENFDSNTSGFFKPNSYVSLYARAREGREKFLIFPSKTTQSLEIGFCAENLSFSDFEQMIEKIEVKRLISPTFILKAKSETEESKEEVSFRKISPVKYQVNIKDANLPFALVFLQRFNPGWKLSGISENNHFTVFNFANGWLINKTGNFNLVLEYSPQRIFNRGIYLTIIMLTLSLIIIVIKKK